MGVSVITIFEVAILATELCVGLLSSILCPSVKTSNSSERGVAATCTLDEEHGSRCANKQHQQQNGYRRAPPPVHLVERCRCTLSNGATRMENE